jgi:hypothetical protein
MNETPQKRVDESWKEQVEREKQSPPPAAVPAGPAGPTRPAGPVAAPGPRAAGPTATPEHKAAEAGPGTADEGLPEARFDLFVSGLAMEALIALGDAPHPVTRKQSMNQKQARYLIDVLGVLEEKTRGNLSADEERLVKDVLYQLRTRYLNKFGG